MVDSPHSNKADSRVPKNMGISSFWQTLEPVPRARHLPGFIYSSREIFDIEKDKIFLKDWLCLGRTEEIPNAGDYMTFRIMDEPVIVARGSGGALNAFSNICAHRGVEVASGNGNAHRFKCPYHGWTYDLTGRLMGATFMNEVVGFDLANCRLSPLCVAEWAGWFFINFDSNCAPLHKFLDEFAKDFNFLRQEDCGLAEKVVLRLDCNWKFVVENVIDIYHVGVLHAKTKGGGFDAKSFKLEARRNGGYYRVYGDGPTTLSKKALFGKMPWLQDKPESYSVMGLLPPNMTLFARIDDIHPFIVWPLTPGTCEVLIYMLFPKTFFDQPDFKTKVNRYKEYLAAVLDEDRGMIASLQRAMGTKRFQPGPMSYLEEGVHHVINSYLERMFGD
jgi:Rieske 2Fe-2S family protein